MPHTVKSAWIDLALSGFVFAGAAILLIGAQSLPAPRFEPLGSAALPRILAGLMIFFAVIVGGSALIRLRPSRTVGQTNSEPPDELYPQRAVAIFVALVAFVSALDILEAPFVPTATAFVAFAGFALSGWRPKVALICGLVGLILAFAIDYVLATFLYITLR